MKGKGTTYLDIIKCINYYKLRKNTGGYTFGFKEDKYRFCYNEHSTGRYLQIFIQAPDGDELLVYDKKEWNSSNYDYHGFGKGSCPGPWVKEIEELFKVFDTEIVKKIDQDKVKTLHDENDRNIIEAFRLNKFTNLCKSKDSLLNI